MCCGVCSRVSRVLGCVLQFVKFPLDLIADCSVFKKNPPCEGDQIMQIYFQEKRVLTVLPPPPGSARGEHGVKLPQRPVSAGDQLDWTQP